MRKTIIRLTESDVHDMVRKTINEMSINSRRFIPKVRGGWNEKKIQRYLKEFGSWYGESAAIKEIAEFDNVSDLRNHLFWHGSPYLRHNLKPSITMSDRNIERNGGGGYGNKYYGISLTKRKKIASNFDYLHGKPKVHPVILAKDAVVKNMEGKISDSIELNEIIVDLYTEGVDAVWIGGGEEELVVINPQCIVNYTNAVQFYNMYYGHQDQNPSLDNPTDDQLQKLLTAAKEMVDFQNNNKNVPIKLIEPKHLSISSEIMPDYEEQYQKNVERYNYWNGEGKERFDKVNDERNKRKTEIRKLIQFNNKN